MKWWQIALSLIYILPLAWLFVYGVIYCFIFCSIKNYILEVRNNLNKPTEEITDKDITPDPHRWSRVFNSKKHVDVFWICILFGFGGISPLLIDNYIDSIIEKTFIIILSLGWFCGIVAGIFFVFETIDNVIYYFVRRKLKERLRRAQQTTINIK